MQLVTGWVRMVALDWSFDIHCDIATPWNLIEKRSLGTGHFQGITSALRARSRLKSHSRANFANDTFASCFSHTKLILDYFAIDNLIISLPFASDLPCAGNILVSCLTLHALFKTNFTFSFLS